MQERSFQLANTILITQILAIRLTHVNHILNSQSILRIYIIILWITTILIYEEKDQNPDEEVG